MQFDAIEAGFTGVKRGLAVVVDHAGDSFDGQRLGHLGVAHAGNITEQLGPRANR
ncbi:hypothetical protein D9M71_528360 [compost metagenome]